MSSERAVADLETEGDFFGLLQVAWTYRYVIGLVTGLCVAAAVVLALTATPIFRAEVTVTDAQEAGLGPAASLASQLGGLAGLAGVSLGGASNAGREARAVLTSRLLAEQFIERNKLLTVLLPQSKQPPTLWNAVQKFRDGVLNIREDKIKGTTTVAIDWTDPASAARWANAVVALTNELVRTRAMNDSTRNIAYLNEELTKTNVVEVRRAMFSLIESETKTLMLTNGRTEYALKVVDPAVTPEVRISPKRTLMVIIGAVLGVLLGAGAAFFHHGLVRYRRRISRAS